MYSLILDTLRSELLFKQALAKPALFVLHMSAIRHLPR